MAAPLHPGGWCLRSGSRGVGQGPCSGHNLPSLSSPGRGQRAGGRGQGAGSSLLSSPGREHSLGLPHQGPRPIRKPPHQLQHHIGSEDASVWIWRDADTQSSARCYEDFEGRDTSKGKGKHARVTRVREKVAVLNSM